MSVARVTEITSQSPRSFEDAIRQGIRRANETLRNISGGWVKEQQVEVADGKITGYRVNLLVTFILEDAPRGRAAAAKAPAPAKAAPAKPAPARKAAPKARARR
ncbi:MAG: dodecin domain-containing protein [Chloroflexi bacterium]|nr:dodecin domain-containing protein [Chloroflexota bacterium]